VDIREIRTDLANFLTHSDEYLRQHVVELIAKLDDIIREENNNINSGRASSLIDSYKSQHELLARQFSAIPVDSKHRFDRLYKAQEVLVTIDTVMYYIKWTLARCTSKTTDHKLVAMLRSDEEYFKEASYRWCQILSSMNAELKIRNTYLEKMETKGND